MLAFLIFSIRANLQISLDGGAATSYNSLADALTVDFTDIHIISGHALYSDFYKIPSAKPKLQKINVDQSVVFDDKIIDIKFTSHSSITSFICPQLTYLCDSAFYGCPKLQQVTCNNVIYISDQIFEKCTDLTSVNLPNLKVMLSPRNWGAHFKDCHGLSRVHFPKLRYINGQDTFVGCLKLEEVNFPLLTLVSGYNIFMGTPIVNINISGLIETNRKMFYNCTYLQTIELEKVAVISRETFSMSSLENVSMPNAILLEYSAFSFSKITEFQEYNIKFIDIDSFKNCSSLISCIASCRYVDSDAFTGCSSLELLNLENNTGNVNCRDCEALSTLICGSRDISTSIFSSHKNIQTIYFPNLQEIPYKLMEKHSSVINVSFPNAKVVYMNAFSQCHELKYISLPSVLSIEGSGNFLYCNKLKDVELPNLIEISGSTAFYGCSSIGSIKCPNLLAIGYSTFEKCSSLKTVEAPKLIEIGKSAFYSTQIESITLNNLFNLESDTFHDCSQLKKIEINKCFRIDQNVFHTCTELCEISFPNLYFIGSQSFYRCSNISIINMPKLLETLYSGIGYHFSHCGNIEELNLPNLRYINGRYTFQDCSSLRKVNLPKLKMINGPYTFDHCGALIEIETPSVVNIDNYSLSYCGSLYKVSFPNVYRIGSYAFSNDLSLKEIDIPLVTKIFEGAFSQCGALVDISFHKLKLLSDLAFYQCNNLVNVDLPELTALDIVGKGNYHFGYCKNLAKISLPKLRYIFGFEAFGYCDKLTQVSMENLIYSKEKTFIKCLSLTELVLESMVIIPSNITISTSVRYVSCRNAIVTDQWAFNELSSLENVYLPNLVCDISMTFYSCKALKSIKLDKLVKIGSKMFYSCNSLSSIELPSLVSAEESNFRHCTNLRTISCPRLIMVLENLNFAENPSLVSVELPNLVKCNGNDFDSSSSIIKIELPSAVLISYNAFCDCSSLSEVLIQKVVYLDEYAFRRCTSLKNVYAPNARSIAKRNNKGGCFESCSSLKEVHFPKLKVMNGEITFDGCKSLEVIDMPQLSLVDISSHTFGGCVSLKSVDLSNLFMIIGTSFIEDCNLPILHLPRLVSVNRKLISESRVASLKLDELIIVDNEMFSNARIEELDCPKIASGINKKFQSIDSLERVKMDNLRVLDAEAFFNNNRLEIFEAKKVAFAFAGAFYQCRNLKHLDFPNLVSINQGVSINGFCSYCSLLKKFEAESLVKIPQYTFRLCPQLKELKTPNCISISLEGLYDCGALENVTFEKLIDYDSGPSYGLASIKELKLPSIRKIDEDFILGMTNIESISANIVSLYLSNSYPLMKAEFPNLISLSKFSSLVEAFDAPKLKALNGATFVNCTKLKKIKMESLIHVNKESYNIFLNCDNLSDLYLGSNPPYTFHKETFKGLDVLLHLPNIGDYLTYDNSVIVDSDVPNDKKWCGLHLRGLEIGVSVNDGTEILYEKSLDDATKSITSVITKLNIKFGKLSVLDFIDSNGKTIGQRYSSLKELIINGNVLLENGIPEDSFKDNSVLEHINLGPLTVLSTNMLKTCKSLIIVEGPCLEEIGDSAFEGHKLITSIDLPSVKIIHGNCFSGCTSLENISLPSLITIDGTNQFLGCEKLSYAALPSLVTISNTNDLFMNCPIKTLVFPSIPPNQYGDGNGFKDKDVDLILPNYEDYFAYDNDLYGSDASNDGKWRGILLRPLNFNMIVNDDKECYGETYEDAIAKCAITGDITRIVIISGKLSKEDFTKIKTNSKLGSFTIENGVNVSDSTIPDNAFANHQAIESINLTGVRIIGESAFSTCSNLKSIHLPNVFEIKSSAFLSCSSLSSIEIPECSIIGDKTFQDCIEIFSILMVKVTILNDNAFKGCTKLNNIVNAPVLTSLGEECFYACGLVGFESNCIEKIGDSCFKLCKNLKNVYLPALTTTIGMNAFENDTSLESISIPKVKTISANAFANLRSLKWIYAGSVESIDERSFYGTSIEELDLPSVTVIIGNEQFGECRYLTTVKLPKLATISPENDLMFNNCQLLREIYLGSTPPSTFNENIFKNLPNLKLIFPKETDFYTYDDDTSVKGDIAGDQLFAGVSLRYMDSLFLKINNININATSVKGAVKRLGLENDQVESIVIHIDFISFRYTEHDANIYPNLKYLEVKGLSTSSLKIPSKCFYKHPSIETIDLQTIYVIGSFGFQYAPKLKNISLSKIDEIEEGAFQGCHNLVTVKADKVIIIGQKAFAGCTNLRELNFEKANNIARNSFENCKSIESVYFGSWKGSEESIYDSMFANLPNLSRIDLPSIGYISRRMFENLPSLREIELLYIKEISDYAFYRCINLHTFKGPKIIYVNSGAFEECYNLKTCILDSRNLFRIYDNAFKSCGLINFSSIYLKYLYHNAFNDCKYLETVNLTAITEINTGTFEGCFSLKSVTLPKVVLISSRAFYNCFNIINIDLSRVDELRGDNHFSNCIRLETIDFSSFDTVSSKSSNIFSNCRSLKVLILGEYPPSVFNRSTFVNANTNGKISLDLPGPTYYYDYDDNTGVEGDVAGDGKWCGIDLKSYYGLSMNIVFNDEKAVDESSLYRACYDAGYRFTNEIFPEITSIFIRNGTFLSGGTKYFSNLVNFTISPDVEINDAVEEKSFFNFVNLKYFSATKLKVLKNKVFYGCKELETIEIPDIRKIGEGCFEKCTKLKNVILNSLVDLQSRAFAGCVMLNSITMDNVEIISDSAFSGCISLESISLNKVTHVLGDNVFAGCSNLKSIELINLQSVDYDAPNLFSDCPLLRNISLPSNPPKAFHPQVFSGMNIFIKLPKITDYLTYDNSLLVNGDVILDCMWCGISFESIIGLLASINGIKIQGNSIEGAIKLSNQDVITEISVIRGKIVFENDLAKMSIKYPELKELSILENVSFLIGSIPPNSFRDHQKLERIEIHGVKRVGSSAFSNCLKLSSIIAPDLEVIEREGFSYTNVSSIELNHLISIGESGFEQCNRLETIISENVVEISAKSFYNCASLKSVQAKNLKVVKERAFGSCSSLVSVSSTVLSEIHYQAFKLCSSLKQIECKNLVQCDDEAFYGTALKSFENNRLNELSSRMFIYCKELVSVKSSRANKIASRCFQHCERLHTIELTSLKEIEDYAFDHCIEIEEVHFSQLLTLGIGSFSNCAKLNKVTMELVTELPSETFKLDASLEFVDFQSLRKVGNEAFLECSKLEKISFKNPTEFLAQSFKNCENLTIIEGEIVSIDDNCFEGCFSLATLNGDKIESIGARAFVGCDSLTNLVFKELRTIKSQTFADSGFVDVVLTELQSFKSELFLNCSKLVNVEAPSLTELIGGGHFKSCTSLKVLSCRNLLNVNSMYDDIFEGCKNFAVFKLGQRIPNIFNNQVFIKANTSYTIDIDLPQYSDYTRYDNSREYIAKGDKANDKMWCNVKLAVYYVKAMFNDGGMIIGSSLDDCFTESGLSKEEITKIQINGGTLSVNDFANMNSRFPNLIGFFATGNINIDTKIITDEVFNSLEEVQEISISTITEIKAKAFSNCPKLKKLVLNNAIILDQSVLSGSNALESVEIPLVTEIPASLFEGKTKLSALSAPSVKKIYEKAFKGCSELKSIVLSKLINLTGDEHFSGCTSLESINLGNESNSLKVDSMSSNIFYGCTSLKEIYLSSTPPATFNKDIFTNRLSALEMKLILPEFQDYTTYDNNVDVTDDKANDGKWYGITLKQILTIVKINGADTSYSGSNLLKAVESSSVSIDLVTKIEIVEGKIADIDFVEGTNTMTTRYPNLAEFIINDDVTINVGDKILPSDSFKDHHNIVKVSLSTFESIGTNVFSGCTKLENISMSRLTEIPSNSFENLASLKHIYFNSVKVVGASAFSSCSSLQLIEITNLKEIKGNAFSGCTSDLLQSLSFPSLLLVINSCFAGMRMRSITISSATSIKESAFEGCANLESISLPKVEEISSNAFNGCSSLVSIEAPILVSLEPDVFTGCSKLKTVRFDILTTLNSGDFLGLTELIEVNIPKLETAGDSAFKGCTSLETIFFPELTTCGNFTFYNCEKLKSVEMPLLSQTSNECFVGCKSLEFVSLPSLAVIKFKSFYNLPKLKNVALDSATEIEESAFEGCGSLEAITAEKVTIIDDRAFYSCSLLPRITVLEVESLGECVFEECSSLESINLPKLSSSGLRCFANCHSLEYANVPALEVIPSEYFLDCISLNEVMITGAIELHDSCFKNCSSIIEIIGSKVTKFVGLNQFSDCVSLVKISFTSLKEVDIHNVGLFNDCSRLQDVYFPEDPPKTFAKGTFDGILDQINLVLPSLDSYYNYDNSNDISDDVAGDCKWCGIFFPFIAMYVTINEKPEVASNSLSKAVALSKESVITSINVTKGKIRTTDFIDSDGKTMTDLYPDLKNFFLMNVQLEGNSIPSRAFAYHESLEEVRMETVEAIESQCFINCSKLKKVVLPNLRNLIDEDVFTNCLSLEEVQMPKLSGIPSYLFEGLNSLKTIACPLIKFIGLYAFNGCENLGEVDFPLVNDLGKYCFKDCIKLKSVEFPLYNDAVSTLFDGCTSLETISMESLEAIEKNGFANMSSLREVVIPKVKEIGEKGFFNCISLESFSSTEVVKIEKSGFKGCKNLKSVELINLISIYSEVFDGCISLETVILPKITDADSQLFMGLESLVIIELPSVKEMSYDVFLNCTSLENISFPLLETCKSRCFKGCKNLRYVDLPLLNTEFGYIFEGCELLEELHVPSLVTFGYDICLNLKKLNTVDLSSAKKFENRAFYNCSSLVTLDVSKIEYLGMRCLYGCSSLQTLVFTSVTEINKSYIFGLCTSLSRVEFPVLTKVASNTGGLFIGCSNFEIHLPSTPPKTFLYSTFDNFDTITLVLPNFEDYYTYDDNTDVENDKAGDGKWCRIPLRQISFEVMINSKPKVTCSSLMEAAELSNVNAADVKNITLISGSNIFRNDELNQFQLNYFVSVSPDLKTIPSSAFAQKNSLIGVNISFTTVIEDRAFYYCSSLTEASFPDVTTINGNYVFAYSGLVSINLPSLETISPEGTSIFANCNLQRIHLGDNPPNVPASIFRNCNDIELILNDESSYFTYDDSTKIEGDKVGDCYWCGIHLKNIAKKITINGNIVSEGSSIYYAILYSNIQVGDIKSLDMSLDEISDEIIMNYVETLPYLEKFTLKASTKFTMPKEMFSGHQHMKSIHVSSNVQLGDSCFEKCVSLTNFEFIYSTELKSSDIEVGTKAFAGCSALERINLDQVTQLGSSAFSGCSMLSSVSLMSLTTLKAETFKDCVSLQQISLNVKRLEGDSHFMGCVKLSDLSLQSLESVEGENIFRDCAALTYLRLGSVPPAGFTNSTFLNMNSNSTVYLVTPSQGDLVNYDPKHTGLWLGIVVQWPKVNPDDDSQEGGGSNAGAIAGGVIGAIIAVIIIVLVVLIVLKKRNGHEKSKDTSDLDDLDDLPNDLEEAPVNDDNNSENEKSSNSPSNDSEEDSDKYSHDASDSNESQV